MKLRALLALTVIFSGAIHAETPPTPDINTARLKDLLASDVNLESPISELAPKKSAKINDVAIGFGSEHYEQGQNYYFFKVDVQGEWSENKSFLVSARGYHAGPHGPGLVPGITLSVVPYYTEEELTKEDAKLKVKQTISYLPLLYERDTFVSVQHSIRASALAIKEDLSVPIAPMLSVFLSLEAHLLSGRWVALLPDNGEYIGYAPLAGAGSAGFVFSPNEKVDLTVTLIGWSGDVSYGGAYGYTEDQPNIQRMTNYSVFAGANLNFKELGLSLNGEVGKITRETTPKLGDVPYTYLNFGVTLNGNFFKKIFRRR